MIFKKLNYSIDKYQHFSPQASLSTFGSRLYICPADERGAQKQRIILGGRSSSSTTNEKEDPLRQLGQCELLLGPKVDRLFS